MKDYNKESIEDHNWVSIQLMSPASGDVPADVAAAMSKFAEWFPFN